MHLRRTASFFALASLAAMATSDAGCLSAPNTGSDAPATPKGCTVASGVAPPMAPNGYYTNGGTVCGTDGMPHLFHGVDRPSLEFLSTGQMISLADFQLMAGWGANVVRISTNQDFWLSTAALHDPTYQQTVTQAVVWAEQAGLDVILDLHWSDCGDLTVTSTASQGCGNSNQQRMADTNSIEFWREVASIFKNDGRVLFELYNEPHNISWDAWLNGGSAGGFVAVGMQQLYDTVRGTGANNVIIAGGLEYAYDLSQVGPSNYVHGYNVMYATHPYLTSGDVASGWETNFGHLETTDFAPVIATEFGDQRVMCTGAWDQDLIAFVDSRKASWTAWAWFQAGCAFPALISDWKGTPTVQGVAVQAALATYPATSPPPISTYAGLLAGDGGTDSGPAALDAGTLDSSVFVDATPALDAGSGGDATLGPDALGGGVVDAADAGSAPDEGGSPADDAAIDDSPASATAGDASDGGSPDAGDSDSAD